MKVYYHGKSPKHKLYVQPGVDHPEISDFMEAPDNNGVARPKLFEVFFNNHVATVIDSLGKYLLDKKLASKNKLILPTEGA
jgi:hypothetical protein